MKTVETKMLQAGKGHLLFLTLLSIFGCTAAGSVHAQAAEAQALPIRGAWLAPREGVPLDSEQCSSRLEEMKKLGVSHVAIGHSVQMPVIGEPRLLWGQGDEELRRVLRRIRRLGLQPFLLPRIESPDFFVPPFPFRADISFAKAADWQLFHEAMGKMLLHYARLAEAEDVQLFGLGLELKQSAKDHEAAWRRIIADVREVYSGKLTYSANWYDEWEQLRFWDALDYVGIGAYFELLPENGDSNGDSVSDLVSRWQPSIERLRVASRKWQRPILFTEIGYTGYADCAERPWEWAGKQTSQTKVDWQRQADCYRALFRAFRGKAWLSGLYVWRFYTDSEHIEDWEYALQKRPAEQVLAEAFAGR